MPNIKSIDWIESVAEDLYEQWSEGELDKAEYDQAIKDLYQEALDEDHNWSQY